MTSIVGNMISKEANKEKNPLVVSDKETVNTARISLTTTPERKAAFQKKCKTAFNKPIPMNDALNQLIQAWLDEDE